MIKYKGSSRNLTRVEGRKTPIDAIETTVPYVTEWELNLDENCPINSVIRTHNLLINCDQWQ